MLIVLSPSKTINFHTPAPTSNQTQPLFFAKAKLLIEKLRTFSAEEIALREEVSLKIAMATREYAHSFSVDPKVTKQAIFAYTGNAYNKLQPHDFGNEDLSFTQDHLRIFSALYGFLRPLDTIQPYRLDMNSKLITGLHETWKDCVTNEVSKLLKADDNILINLASAEYFKLVNTNKLPSDYRIITPVFKQEQHGRYTTKSLFAKEARGLMARFIIKNRISDPEHLQGFTEGGYYFCPELSQKNEWIFTRLENNK